MARYVKDTPRRSNPANPSVLGVDLGDAVYAAGGAFGAEFLNQQVVTPVIQKVIKPANANNFMAKIADFVFFLGAGVLARDLTRMVVPDKVRAVTMGITTMAGIKLGSAVIPGMSVNAKLPNIGSLFGAGAPPPAPALPAQTGGTAVPSAGVGSAPLLAAPAFDRYPPVPGYGTVPSTMDVGL